MIQEERLDFLINALVGEQEVYSDLSIPAGFADKQRLLRSLMNVRLPAPISAEFLEVQDAYLQEQLAQRGITNMENLSPVKPGIYLWQGDITTLAVDAIVNAANSRMLGCFVPCHGCIDNILFLELGVGSNTPGIIKYPFWKMTNQNPNAVYACINLAEAYAPREIRHQSICLSGDIGNVLHQLSQ